MRRSITVLLAGLALLASAAPAQATTRVPFVGPPRSYELVGVCPFTISAQERADHPGYLTLDDNGEVVQVQFQGSFDTVLSSSLGELAFESIGSTVVTANADGTWTMVQKGSGLAVVPATDPAAGPAASRRSRPPARSGSRSIAVTATIPPIPWATSSSGGSRPSPARDRTTPRCDILSHFARAASTAYCAQRVNSTPLSSTPNGTA